jgi:hypothetical protein
LNEDYDQFESAALVANTPLWKLAEPQRKRLIGRVRNVVNGMANVGGDRHENMREARQQVRETVSSESAIDLMGQQQFNDFVKWAYLRAEREGVQ